MITNKGHKQKQKYKEEKKMTLTKKIFHRILDKASRPIKKSEKGKS